MACHERSIDKSKYIQFFNYLNTQTLFYLEQRGGLYTSYHIRLISYSNIKILKQKLCHGFLYLSDKTQVASENLVASAQHLVTLATSESQFRALGGVWESFHGEIYIHLRCMGYHVYNLETCNRRNTTCRTGA